MYIRQTQAVKLVAGKAKLLEGKVYSQCIKMKPMRMNLADEGATA